MNLWKGKREMNGEYKFDRDAILGEGIYDLNETELLELARGLCRALIEIEGDVHGNIYPGNISLNSEGEVGLGPMADHETGKWGKDELMYMSPELFYGQEADNAADIYSIGLLMYVGLTGGILPFEDEADGASRPLAIRRRMSGEDIALPRGLDESMQEVLRGALAYDISSRMSGPVEMLSALTACIEGIALSAAGSVYVPSVGASEEFAPLSIDEDVSRTDLHEAADTEKVSDKKYKVDKSFEERVAPKPERKKLSYAIPASLAMMCILALGIAFFVSMSREPTVSLPPINTGVDAVTGEDTTAVPTAPVVSGTLPTQPSEEPEPTEPVSLESTYEIFIEDVTWLEARELCMEKGGNLVTINDEAEFEEVTALADSVGITLVWVGLYRSDSGELATTSGEDIDFYPWAEGEPTVTDTSGTSEDYVLMWNLRGGGWEYNDTINDPVSLYPASYSGKIAYICEYN